MTHLALLRDRPICRNFAVLWRKRHRAVQVIAWAVWTALVAAVLIGPCSDTEARPIIHSDFIKGNGFIGLDTSQLGFPEQLPCTASMVHQMSAKDVVSWSCPKGKAIGYANADSWIPEEPISFNGLFLV
jgi:hypothetical protein